MNFAQPDKLSQLINPIAMIVLIVLAFVTFKNYAWPFLLRNGLAVVVVQQISKFVQKRGPFGDDFPSTHLAVALAVSIGIVIVRPKLWPLVLAYPILYSVLMYYRGWHTPVEMLGALFAIPLTLLFHLKPRKSASEAAIVSNN